MVTGVAVLFWMPSSVVLNMALLAAQKLAHIKLKSRNEKKLVDEKPISLTDDIIYKINALITSDVGVFIYAYTKKLKII